VPPPPPPRPPAAADRTLRRDAARNRDLLLAAARHLFAERGVDVPLEEIARRAGVSIGTLYNRFPTRAALVEAVFIDRLERTMEFARAASVAADPWEGFTGFVTGVCELQAMDRGFNDVAAHGLADSPAARALRDEALSVMESVMTRAQASGQLRDDVTVEDLALFVWAISRSLELTSAAAPRLWRRHLALLLDGYRAEGAHPLPEPPMAAGHHRARTDPEPPC
jgi:AcrR family transcriptional regulator